MIDNLLKQSDCSLSQVDAVAFGAGPGSFTGVRIGIGVAQGLALGIDKPMIGVSTLMTLAQGVYRTKQKIGRASCRETLEIREDAASYNNQEATR